MALLLASVAAIISVGIMVQRLIRMRDSFNGADLMGDAIFAAPTVPGVEAIGLDDLELVLGTVVGGEARAYPIAVLERTEYLNDICGGRPILATW